MFEVRELTTGWLLTRGLHATESVAELRQGLVHTPSIAFRHLPPKDVVNQCLEFGSCSQSVKVHTTLQASLSGTFLHEGRTSCTSARSLESTHVRKVPESGARSVCRMVTH